MLLPVPTAGAAAQRDIIMWDAVITSLGGLGVFLFGMITMTGGLKALAGSSLRRGLSRFTRNPTTGAVSGAVATALVQSSSATTVIAIGFCSAGLMTFGQALGIVFGANLGTTATGWIVGLLGFKLGLLKILFPGLFAGALLAMFGSQRWQATGRVLVGFSLVFVGLDFLQDGLSSLELSPSQFPDDSLGGRALLLLLGLVITLLTQSSSAGIAAAMAAVLADTINLRQAAAMVIGMDIGTTVTAIFASIGGNLAARRTGVAHVVYNLGTGIAAFFFLPVYFWLWQWLGQPGAAQPQLVLVAFHTLFNGLGVMLVLPFTERFARLIQWLVRARVEDPTVGLHRRLCQDGHAALDAVGEATRLLTIEVLQMTGLAIDGRVIPVTEPAGEQLRTTRAYLLDIEGSPHTQERHIAAVHVVDHLERLLERIERARSLHVLHGDERLTNWSRPLAESCQQLIGALERQSHDEVDIAVTHGVWQSLEQDRDRHRRTLMTVGTERTKAIDSEALDQRLDALRWLRRSAYHVNRITAWWRALVVEDEVQSGESD